MRPREREDTASPVPPSPPPPPPTTTTTTEAEQPALAVTGPRVGGGLSSMVVRPSHSGGGGGSDAEAFEAHASGRREKSSPPYRRRSSPTRGPRRRGSPPSFRRRDSSTHFRRRDSPPPNFRRRDSPPDFYHQPHRFNESPGYGMHAGSFSPPRRLGDSHYDPDFDHPVRPSFGRGFRGGRGNGTFRDTSFDPVRGGSGRGYKAAGRHLSPFEGEYVHRNDPNLSPREGDWICQNPSCGNLNFARRTYCNNCNECRFVPGRRGISRSPRRGYYNSPSPTRSPPRITGPPVERGGMRRGMNGYRSPPHGWTADDPRDFRSGSPSPRRGARFPDDLRRERLGYRGEQEYGERHKYDWPRRGEWDQDRDGFITNKRGFDRRSPSPRGRWVRDVRERSRSPMGGRLLPYMGRGRGDHRRHDDSYISQGRFDDSDVGRGRGYRRVGESLIGRGRDRRGLARGSNGSVY